MLLFILAVYLGIFCIALYILFRYKNSRDLPPGPWNVPILGSLLQLDPQTPYISLTKLSQVYGPIYSLKLGKLYTVVVSDAKLIRQILIKDESTGRAPLYFLETVFKGKGILFAQGALWKDHRKLVINFLNEVGASKISPNRNYLQNQIMKSVDDFIQYIQNQGDRIVVNFSKVIVHNIASVSTFLLLGKFWERDDKFWKDLLSLFIEGSRLTGAAGPLNFLPFLRFLPKYKNLLGFIFKAYNILYNTNNEIIKETKKNQLKKNTPPNLIQAFLKGKLAQNTDEFYADDQLCCLLLDMFGASIDSTANSLSWMILYLAKYPDVQEKMREEIKEVLQREVPKIEDLSNLSFTEATIAEVARIRTVVPLGIPHCALEDIVIDTFKIPKGTMIMPLLWGIHMDPKIWEDPEKFRPERFLDDEGRCYKPEAFMPFQAGKRKCVGEELAKMVIFLFTVTIVRNFEIECEEGKEVDLTGIYGVTLQPKPQNVVFKKIQI